MSVFATKKLFGLIQVFFTRKFLLTPPKKAPVLVLDRQSLLKMKEAILEGMRYSIYDEPAEAINLFIFFLGFWKIIKKRKVGYLETFTEYVQPKIAISYIDTNFYYLSAIFDEMNVALILIQNGRATSNRDFFLKGQKFYIYQYFVHCSASAEYFKKFFDTKITITGSIIGNQIAKPKLVHVKRIQFISQFRQNEYAFVSDNKKVCNRKSLLEPDVHILTSLAQFCAQKQLPLEIIGSSNLEEEKKYFSAIFRKLNFTNYRIFQKYDKDDYIFAYQKLAADAIVVGLDSALIFEAFGIGFRTCIFPIRASFMNDESRKFGWPQSFKKNRGLYWNNTLDSNENQKILEFLYNIKQKDWDIIRQSSNYKFGRDYKNKILKSTLLDMIGDN